MKGIRFGAKRLITPPAAVWTPGIPEAPADEKRIDIFDSSFAVEADKKALTIVKSGDVVSDYQNVRIRGYLSTFSDATPADRQGHYVLPTAFDETIPKFLKRNPVMLMDHWNRVENAIGMFEVVRPDSKGLYVEGLLSNSPLPAATHCRYIVAEGILRTMSMGGFFYFDESGRGIFKVELFEGSLTPIPVNPDAIISTRSLSGEDRKAVSDGIEVGTFREMRRKFLHDTLAGGPWSADPLPVGGEPMRQ